MIRVRPIAAKAESRQKPFEVIRVDIVTGAEEVIGQFKDVFIMRDPKVTQLSIYEQRCLLLELALFVEETP